MCISDILAIYEWSRIHQLEPKTKTNIVVRDLQTTLMSKEIFSRCRHFRNSIINFYKIPSEYLITVKLPFAEARLD